MAKWHKVCKLDDITPKTGVCALIEGKQIALFRPRFDDIIYAIDNMDPFAHSNVLSRGIICEYDDQLWVASPLKKQRFNLASGVCFEEPNIRLQSYPTRVQGNQIEIQV